MGSISISRSSTSTVIRQPRSGPVGQNDRPGEWPSSGVEHRSGRLASNASVSRADVVRVGRRSNSQWTESLVRILPWAAETSRVPEATETYG